MSEHAPGGRGLSALVSITALRRLGAVSVALACACLGAIAARPAQSPPAALPVPRVVLDALTAPAKDPGWHSCTPRSAHLVGPYRVYDDAFGERRECIRSTGANFLVETSSAPGPGGVVAYPAIQYGSAYDYTTKGSGLPKPVSRMYHPLLSDTVTGSARGPWIADYDSWFFPSRNTDRHGTAEMIIVERYPAGLARGSLVRIAGKDYWLRSAYTCTDGADGECTSAPWPLIRFFAVHQASRAAGLPFRAFVQLAIRRGYLPRSDWWGSTDFGDEIWRGGRGLRNSLNVTWRKTCPRLQHICGGAS